MDFTTIYNFGFYADFLFTLCTFAYPFRFFLFAVRFNQAKAIKVHLNTIVRTFPGISVLVSITFVVALGFVVVYYVLLGTLIPEMNNPLTAFLLTTSQDLFKSQSFLNLI